MRVQGEKGSIHPHRLLALCIGIAIYSSGGSAYAQGRGDGGCVIIANAPIYKTSRDNAVIATKDVGDCVAGAQGVLGIDYVFDEENGRLGIMFLPKGDRGRYQRGWMNATDLSRFTWECGCAVFAGSPKKACQPFILSSGFDFAYNSCFKEGQEKKKAEIFRQTAAPSSPDGNSNAKRSEKALRNDDILTLVKVGLDEHLIISKIKNSESAEFDLSTEGIVVLKTAKVSNAIIDAMMKRSEVRR
jgi:hypothetical protein